VRDAQCERSSGTRRNNASNSNKIVVRRHPNHIRSTYRAFGKSGLAQWRFRQYAATTARSVSHRRATERQRHRRRRARGLAEQVQALCKQQQSGPSSEEAVAAMARQSAAQGKSEGEGAVLSKDAAIAVSQCGVRHRAPD
jgi:hypothetical protein